MRITEQNIYPLLTSGPTHLPDVLAAIFATILDPNVDEDLLLTCMTALHQRFGESLVRQRGRGGFNAFGQAAVKAGIIKTMMTLTRTTRSSEAYVRSAYRATECICHLLRSGTVKERRDLTMELLKYDVLDVCLDKVSSHPFCIHRQNGLQVFRALAADGFLGDYISSQETSKITTVMCEYTLGGPAFFVEQMGSPGTTWQISMAFGNRHMTMTQGAKYAPRFYAMAQEMAMWTIHGLFCRSPPPSHEFISEVLAHNSQLLDLLFRCAALRRTPWYPESEVSSIAAEAITQVFRAPTTSVPGVCTSPNGLLPKEDDDQWKGLLKSVNILTSRPKWVEMIIAIWTMLSNEKWQDLKKLIKEPLKYHAQVAPDQEQFLSLFEYRGTSRICIFRIIATLTHLADECNIPTADLVSLLPIASAGCRNIKKLEQCYSEGETYVCVERSAESFRSPFYANFTGDKVDPPVQIADEAVLGPTAFFRLLAALAGRGVSPADIQKWKELPEGTSSSVTLSQVKQIVSSEALRRVIPLAVKRVTARRETGHDRLRRVQEPDYAGFAYSSAAELAAAVVEFNVRMEGTYGGELVKGVRKEMVLCLGNAAEMALVLRQWERALSYALGADVGAVGLEGGGDAVGAEVVAKNRRRVERARSGLAAPA